MRLLINRAYLRRRRDAHEWTQWDLADKAGLSERTVRNAENEGLISPSSLRAICYALLLKPGYTPSSNAVDDLVTRMCQTAGTSGSTDEETAPAVARSAIARSKKRPLAKTILLDSMQTLVMDPRFVLNEANLKQLREEESSCLRATDESGLYANLIVGYALLKAGPEISGNLRGDFVRMRRIHRVREGRSVERMAAMWIIARAHLSWMSVARGTAQRRLEAEIADGLLSQIKAVSSTDLRMPLLLPGAQQEIAHEKLRQLDSSYPMDPLALEIVVPHRYLAATAVSLAELDRAKQSNHLGKAERHCTMRAEEADNESTLRMNIDLLRLDAETLRCAGRRVKATEKTKLVDRVKALESRIRATDKLSAAKSNEWLAHCKACHTILKAERSEDDLPSRLATLVKGMGLVPDFLMVDPVYKLALDAEHLGHFEDVLRELKTIVGR